MRVADCVRRVRRDSITSGIAAWQHTDRLPSSQRLVTLSRVMLVSSDGTCATDNVENNIARQNPARTLCAILILSSPKCGGNLSGNDLNSRQEIQSPSG